MKKTENKKNIIDKKKIEMKLKTHEFLVEHNGSADRASGEGLAEAEEAFEDRIVLADVETLEVAQEG
jgi:hypothetical protein